MQDRARMLLHTFFATEYIPLNFSLRESTLKQLEVAISVFRECLGKPPKVADLTDKKLLKLMKWMHDAGRAPDTINSKRRALINIWKCAYSKRLTKIEPPTTARVPCARTIERNPTAWSEEEFQSLLDACSTMPIRRGWGPLQWQALLLTVYDTGERIGALMKAPRGGMSWVNGQLRIPGEVHKTRADRKHDLHQDTVALLKRAGIDSSGDRVFNYPFHYRDIWCQYNKLLEAAGLPQTRRDKFHRIRRTGYTIVYIAADIGEAMLYAGHKTDLSPRYLDSTKLAPSRAIGLLPRPVLYQ